MHSPLRNLVRAASLLLLLLGACASPSLAIRVENAAGTPIDSVDCRISADGRGVGGGVGLAPSQHATFDCPASEASEVTLEVRWTEGGAVERIELGPVRPPGASVRLLGPGRFELLED